MNGLLNTRTRKLALAITAASCVVISSTGLSAGQIVDDMVVEVEAWEDDCEITNVGVTRLHSYCGDENGCTIRLVFQDLMLTLPLPPASFSVSDEFTDSDYWVLSGFDITDDPVIGLESRVVQGYLGDFSADEILSIYAPGNYYPKRSCRFREYILTNWPVSVELFGLEACGNSTFSWFARCTLTIED